MKKYAVVIEAAAAGNYSAYVPDLPGCVAVGDTVDEVEEMIREAIAFHLEGIQLNGEIIPQSSSLCQYIEISDVA